MFITAATIDIRSNETTISLHSAAMLTSQVTEILLHCNCQQPAKRCSCFKSGVKCTNYCHQSNDVTDACANLASKEERNIWQVIPRIPKNIPQSTSGLSAPTTSDKEIPTTGTSQRKVRKRRASCLSQPESSNVRYRRSWRAVPVAQNVFDDSLEDTLDTIVVQKE